MHSANDGMRSLCLGYGIFRAGSGFNFQEYKGSDVAAAQAIIRPPSVHDHQPRTNFMIMTLRNIFVFAGIVSCVLAQSTYTLSGCHTHDGQE